MGAFRCEHPFIFALELSLHRFFGFDGLKVFSWQPRCPGVRITVLAVLGMDPLGEGCWGWNANLVVGPAWPPGASEILAVTDLHRSHWRVLIPGPDLHSSASRMCQETECGLSLASAAFESLIQTKALSPTYSHLSPFPVCCDQR